MPAYRELLVWQRGIELTVELYGFARTLPPDERFGLCTQLQRAGVSIPANVSEGHSRRSPGPFLNHISIAIGSQAEVETLLEACRRLKFGDPARLVRCEHTAAEVGKMLYGLHASVKRSRRYGLGLLYSIILAASVLWYWFPRAW